jgi:hypothetical protein
MLCVEFKDPEAPDLRCIRQLAHVLRDAFAIADPFRGRFRLRIGCRSWIVAVSRGASGYDEFGNSAWVHPYIW